MSEKLLFYVDLEANKEYIYKRSNGDVIDELDCKDSAEYPLGTAFTEYLDNCFDGVGHLSGNLFINYKLNFGQDELEKAEEVHKMYLELFESGMIEDINLGANDPIYRKIYRVYSINGYEKIEELIMRDISIELINYKGKLLPFYVVDKTFAAVMKAYFYAYLTERANIKKCENCGKYFIYAGNYDYIFCSRYCDEKGHTCRQAGPLKKRNKKIRDNPVLDTYRKAYNKKNMARARGSITKEEFELWRMKAKAMLQAVQEGGVTKNDYFGFISPNDEPTPE